MTCKQTADRVTDYLEGCLTPEQHQQVEQHLATCRDCRTYFDQMRQFVTALPAPTEPEAPVEVPSVILEAFLTGKRPLKTRSLGLPQIVAVSVVVVILALVCLSIRMITHRGGRPGISPSYNSQTAVLDLREWSVLRGESNLHRNPLQLRRGRLALSILLPIGREPGEYEITLLERSGRPVVTARSTGQLEDHATVLHVNLDLRTLPGGSYQLGVWQQGWDWTYYPLLLR